MGERYLCIHGHFYQPPRENPWLEAVEVQDSARPAHDWNERVADECYGPNASARILSAKGAIRGIISNYEFISFNFGPTLLAWMKTTQRHHYRAVIAADVRSRARFGGHGNAIAQAYNHTILPLAPRRDKELQVRWGIEDFRFHFGRKPEGMWLPECAVDTETLEVLAEHDIAFTILAPHQAAKVRPTGAQNWQDVGDNAAFTPQRPYRVPLPSGRSIVVFFYDDPIARAVAFEGLLSSGDRFFERLTAAFDGTEDSAGDEPRLVHIATDGESYGHHHRYGDMALAAMLTRAEADDGVTLINYAQFLEQHPPVWDARIVDDSSWSCVHGVERWRANCGCNVGGYSDQRWREPLREGLDTLRDELDRVFETEGAKLLADPWAARDAYIGVVLDRSNESVDAFLTAHAKPTAGAEAPDTGDPRRDAPRVRILELMETARAAQLMFTSCGWFFDDIAGIEATQILRYAGRAIQLASRYRDDLEAPLLDRLATAPANKPDVDTGRDLYLNEVTPAVADLERVVAHVGVIALFEEQPLPTRLYCYHCEFKDFVRTAYRPASLGLGRLRVTSMITTDVREALVAVLHFGNHDVYCAVREAAESDQFDSVRRELFRVFADQSLADVVRWLDLEFDGNAYSLADLFLDDRRQVLARATRENLEQVEQTYRRLYEDNLKLMQVSRRLSVPLPRAFVLAAEYVLHERLGAAIDALYRAVNHDNAQVDQVRSVLAEAEHWGIVLDAARLEPALRTTLERHLADLHTRLGERKLDEILELFELAREIPITLNRWAMQNAMYRLLTAPDFRVIDDAPGDARKRLLALANHLNLDEALVR